MYKKSNMGWPTFNLLFFYEYNQCTLNMSTAQRVIHVLISVLDVCLSRPVSTADNAICPGEDYGKSGTIKKIICHVYSDHDILYPLLYPRLYIKSNILALFGWCRYQMAYWTQTAEYKRQDQMDRKRLLFSKYLLLTQ